MNVRLLLLSLKKSGIKIQLVDNRLELYPKEKLTPDLLHHLKSNKKEIIEFIQNRNLKKNYEYIPILPKEKREYYELSSAQQRLYILNQIDPNSTSYNLPQIIYLNENIDRRQLEVVFNRVINRHEALRTFFRIVNNRPVQWISDHHNFSLEELEESKLNGSKKSMENSIRLRNLLNSFIRPFNLLKGPLLRAVLVKTVESRKMLLIDFHHIITDATSHLILERDIVALYREKALNILKLQYKDYAVWQNTTNKKRLKQQETFWIKKLGGKLPILDLPTDFPRPLKQSFEGASVGFFLEQEATESLINIAKNNNVTTFMFILAVFYILLNKLSGQKDIIIGTDIAGRNHVDLQGIVGMFVNILALRNYPVGHLTFLEFLDVVKNNTIEAFENQDYQFEDLVEVLNLKRDLSRNPLFDVILTGLDNSKVDIDLSDIKTGEEYRHIKGTSKFDLNLISVDLGKTLFFKFEYCIKLFKPGTIERIIVYLKNIFLAIIKNPHIRISEIEIVGEEEVKSLLKSVRKKNEIGTNFPPGRNDKKNNISAEFDF